MKDSTKRHRMIYYLGLTLLLYGCAPAVDFSADPTQGTAPLTVTLTSTSESQSEVTERKWEFGDGQTATSADQSVQHIYTVAGSYTVKLTEKNKFGKAFTIKKNYITVTDADLPTARFSANPTKGKISLQVDFTDTSEAGGSEIVSWLWDFGNSQTSTEQNPSYIYDEVGVYDVKLTVITDAGSDTQQAKHLIVAQSPHQIPGIYNGPFINDYPGSEVTYEDIVHQLSCLAPYTDYVSFYSVPNMAEVASTMQLKSIIMVWLSDDLAANDQNIANAIANQELASMFIVGDRVLEQNTLTQGQLVGYIKQLDQATDVPVGYSDVYDEIMQAEEVWAVVDFVGLNYTPYWIQDSVADPLADLQQKYHDLKKAVGDIPVFITDTGWPLTDNPEVACSYFAACLLWTENEDVTIIYFEAYDESYWRSTNWSIFNLDGTPKECIKNALMAD